MYGVAKMVIWVVCSTGTLDAIIKMIRFEGLSCFYKGMSTKIVQSVFAASVLFMLKEELVKAYMVLADKSQKILMNLLKWYLKFLNKELMRPCWCSKFVKLYHFYNLGHDSYILQLFWFLLALRLSFYFLMLGIFHCNGFHRCTCLFFTSQFQGNIYDQNFVAFI